MNNIKETYDVLLNKISSLNKEELDKINKAYEYALKEHKDKKRINGDNYILHPLNVAIILSDLCVECDAIVASLLHEVLNHGTNATYEEISDLFGEEVADIVKSISKINKLELTDDNESSAIYLRKVLVGLSIDPRVLYIKLADRLHNMRTIHVLDENIQKIKAKETMNVLVPIAHRLGINTIKSELEDLSLKVLKPDEYNEVLEKLNKTKNELNDNLNVMKDNISNLLNDNKINHKIKGRVKSIYSIYNKLSKGRKWDDIYDILALRVFVETEEECYKTINLIHSKYVPVPKRFKDYIAKPKENMYQSLHTTVYGKDDSVYEIQVRTYEMDEIAEKGIASHWSYKENGTKKVQAMMEQKLEMFRNIIENDESFSITTDDIKEDLLGELIYVFTPKGDVIELPKDATPIDFAYRIHSKVGDTTIGAIVNDSIVPLTYNIQNNDVVKIITNSSSSPKEDWLNIVKTPQAKAKIKAYFSKKDHDELVIKGKNILEKELKKRHLVYSEIFTNEVINKILKDLKAESMEDIYLSLGSLRFTASYIINLTKDDKQNVQDILMEKLKSINISNSKDDIIVDGKNDILYNLAKCCKPVKGDEIIGYITKGDGISVHKKNCCNVINNERLINVEWNYNVTNTYYTDICVRTTSNTFLADLLNESTKNKILISEIKNKQDNNGNIYYVTIKVKDKDELEHFKRSLNTYKNVYVED